MQRSCLLNLNPPRPAVNPLCQPGAWYLLLGAYYMLVAFLPDPIVSDLSEDAEPPM